MATKGQIGRPRIDGRVQNRLEVLVHKYPSWSAAQHHKELEREQEAKEPPFDGEHPPRLHERRTTERLVPVLRSKDMSTAWSSATATADEARFVPDALAIVTLHSAGRRTSISKAEAAAFVNVRLIAGDDFPLYSAYLTAALLVSRQSRNLPTDDIDVWLALKPWRSPKTYEWALNQPQSRLTRAPVALLAYNLSGGVPLTLADLERLEENLIGAGQREFISEEAIERLSPSPHTTTAAPTTEQQPTSGARRRKTAASGDDQ
jgi:hypothetical protein